MVNEIKTPEEFEQLLHDTSRKFLVVDFYAQWCRPCKMFAPRFNELAELYGTHVAFCKVDVDELEDLTGTYGISSLPTFKVLATGVNPTERVVHTVVGVGTESQTDLENTIKHIHEQCESGVNEDGCTRNAETGECADNNCTEGNTNCEETGECVDNNTNCEEMCDCTDGNTNCEETCDCT